MEEELLKDEQHTDIVSAGRIPLHLSPQQTVMRN